MPEETSKEVKLHVSPTCGSGFSRYRVMVNYSGVYLFTSTILKYSNRGIEFL